MDETGRPAGASAAVGRLSWPAASFLDDAAEAVQSRRADLRFFGSSDVTVGAVTVKENDALAVGQASGFAFERPGMAHDGFSGAARPAKFASAVSNPFERTRV